MKKNSSLVKKPQKQVHKINNYISIEEGYKSDFFKRVNDSFLTKLFKKRLKKIKFRVKRIRSQKKKIFNITKNPNIHYKIIINKINNFGNNDNGIKACYLFDKKYFEKNYVSNYIAGYRILYDSIMIRIKNHKQELFMMKHFPEEYEILYFFVSKFPRKLRILKKINHLAVPNSSLIKKESTSQEHSQLEPLLPSLVWKAQYDESVFQDAIAQAKDLCIENSLWEEDRFLQLLYKSDFNSENAIMCYFDNK